MQKNGQILSSGPLLAREEMRMMVGKLEEPFKEVYLVGKKNRLQ